MWLVNIQEYLPEVPWIVWMCYIADANNHMEYLYNVQWVDLIFGVLMPLSAVFQLYHGDQF